MLTGGMAKLDYYSWNVLSGRRHGCVVGERETMGFCHWGVQTTSRLVMGR